MVLKAYKALHKCSYFRCGSRVFNRNNLFHGRCTTTNILCPTSQYYGHAPHKVIPSSFRFNESLHLGIYDRMFVPLARKFTGLNQGIGILHRMGIGLVISMLATLVAGFIEVKRKQAALASGLHNTTSTLPISVFWLVPQYSLHGISEAFLAVGHLAFFYDQAPESIRSAATALFWTAKSVGNYVSTILVSLVTKFSAGPNGSNWLPDKNLNQGKLEYFYWLITCLQVLNIVYYILCAKFYTFKILQIETNEGENSKGETLQLENGI